MITELQIFLCSSQLLELNAPLNWNTVTAAGVVNKQHAHNNAISRGGNSIVSTLDKARNTIVLLRVNYL